MEGKCHIPNHPRKGYLILLHGRRRENQFIDMPGQVYPVNARFKLARAAGAY
jgi:hypothetical protein